MLAAGESGSPWALKLGQNGAFILIALPVGWLAWLLAAFLIAGRMMAIIEVLGHDAAHDALSDVRATLALARLVRAFNPVPGAYVEIAGERLKLLTAEVVAARGAGGTVGAAWWTPWVWSPERAAALEATLATTVDQELDHALSRGPLRRIVILFVLYTIAFGVAYALEAFGVEGGVKEFSVAAAILKWWVLVSLAGTLLMIALACVMEWYRRTGALPRPSGSST